MSKEDKELNIIKKTCKELDLTYKQLAEKIGYSEATINKLASTGEISEAIETAINLYVENLTLKTQIEEIETLKKLLKSFFK